MRIFKYGKKQHIMGLLGMGGVRIGTLSDYRRVEHAKGISDPSEGTKKVINSLDKFHLREHKLRSRDNDTFAMLNYYGIPLAKGGQVISMGGGTFIKNHVHDAYVYCFALEENPSTLTMQQFQGADCCVEIFDSQKFFDTLTSIVVEVQGVRRMIPPTLVNYKSRELDYKKDDIEDHPALIKEPIYKRQNEGRIIWELEPRDNSYTPFFSGHWSLGSCCKLIDLNSL